jgi:fission process protein 1
MGYANAVGESFRYQFPKFVVPSYVLLFGYCFADAATSGRKAYNDAQNKGATKNIHAAVAIATTDTLIWHSLASVLIPEVTINAIVKASRWTVSSPPHALPPLVVMWLPTAAWLGSIPLIIHPIDKGVDWFMEHTFRKVIQMSSVVVTPTEYNQQLKTAPTTENIILSNALGSAAEGIIARVMTNPLDTAKARL